MVFDQTLNVLFLLGAQTTATAGRPSAPSHVKATNALLLIPLDDHADSAVTQTNFLRDPMPVHTALIGVASENGK
jgi:hypothetical protein